MAKKSVANPLNTTKPNNYGSDLETNLNHMYQVSNYPCFHAISLYKKACSEAVWTTEYNWLTFLTTTSF